MDDETEEGLAHAAVPALSAHLPALAEEIIATIAVEVPAYARPLEGAFGEGMRRGVEQALGQFVEMVRTPGTGRAAGREIYTALGHGEVRAGRSLDVLLAAYRVGARVAWRRLAEVGMAAGFSSATLVTFAESIFAYIDEISAESAEGFAAEQAERAGEAEGRRTALIALLLAVPRADPAAVSLAAEAARWRVPHRLAVVVWPAALGRRPAARLPVGSLSALFAGAPCAIVVDPDAPGRREELVHALSSTTSAMGSVVPSSEGARSLRRAIATLAIAEERGSEALLFADQHRAELLCRAEPDLVAEMAEERLAPLHKESELSRARLEATLDAWLRHEGNVALAAEGLVVHPQTVRYRVGRLRELLGDALDDADARFELEVALRAARGRAA